MADSSNALLSASTQIQDYEYLCASNTNVSNFVSVKLSGTNNYFLWKAQMLCLLDTHNMCGIVDSTFVVTETNLRRYDSLVKGWIFGSVSEDVLVDVYNLGSAKAVWEKLKAIFDPITSLEEGSTSKKSDAKTEKDVSAKTNKQDTNSIQIIVPTETETNNEDSENKIKDKKMLHKYTIKGDWSMVEFILKTDEGLATEAINSDGSTILHIAVGTGQNGFVKKLCSFINAEQVLQKRDSDGSTALHIAAIVGNKQAAELLVKKNNMLLRIKDRNGEVPLQKALENMHLDTIAYLLKAVNDDAKIELQSSIRGSVNTDDEIGVHVLVNAISAKQYHLALELVQKFPRFASKSDDVLMAIAKNFPAELNYGETLMCPWLYKLQNIGWFIGKLFGAPLYPVLLIPDDIAVNMLNKVLVIIIVIAIVPCLIWWPIAFVICLIRFALSLLYALLWEGALILAFAPVKNIDVKMTELEEAKEVLELVCDEIDKLECNGTHHPYYTRPILEAACRNAYRVVDEILFRSCEAIQSKDDDGYDIIQLAIIHRSEKIYNLIYGIGERKNLYRTIVDSSKNNISHLAGKLAPLNVLNQRTGAALQLQRELQWHEEVKKHVFPTYITQENKFKETPDMVFTREHEKLVKEGEEWMKTTSESCSITAALITTIVFAAAITVPGGSNQEKGTPLFKNETAFIIFAISDAVSLFASSTALLVFLSILTTRFAEKDFLVSLPRRLFIGLFSLLLSTIAMMVAFSATLFLVFCEQKPWMLAPICGLASIPIASFVTLQFPLMVDLFSSTYLHIFGKQRASITYISGKQRASMVDRFNPNDIRLFFGK
ncbi:hypothetical protein QVD17_27565 [Tagetes erecta]|uniref:PGG domain-containing protein n=1 Tax=Tagetes erecta TaxID=13708 RepID=A0AAD8KC67_TARER|nr:hypothetical protein QVD17_27565 [Tagetes erecta]